MAGLSFIEAAKGHGGSVSPRRARRPKTTVGEPKVDGRATDTAERIVAAALGLFAERGYDATSVADIEAAVGLTPGAGGLYRHFASKRDVLAAAVRAAADATASEVAPTPSGKAPKPPSSVLLEAVGRAGLDKLRAERDLTRVIFRDLDHFPDLLAEVRDGDVQRTYTALAAWLEDHSADPGLDFEALAAVLGGAIANYWIVREFFGTPPGRVPEDRFLAAWAAVASSALRGNRDVPGTRLASE